MSFLLPIVSVVGFLASIIAFGISVEYNNYYMSLV